MTFENIEPVILQKRSRASNDPVSPWNDWLDIADDGVFLELVNECIQVRVKPVFKPGYFRDTRKEKSIVEWWETDPGSYHQRVNVEAADS